MLGIRDGFSGSREIWQKSSFILKSKGQKSKKFFINTFYISFDVSRRPDQEYVWFDVFEFNLNEILGLKGLKIEKIKCD